MITTKIVRGWGLRQANGRMRTYGVTDCLGMMSAQIAMWPLKSLAKQMALPTEKPVKVRALYASELDALEKKRSKRQTK